MSAMSAPRLSVYFHPPLCLHAPSTLPPSPGVESLPSQPPKRAETPLSAPLRQAILSKRNALLERLESSTDNAYWAGLEPADASQSARFVMLLTYLGHQKSPRVEQLAEHLRRSQLAAGGWASQNRDELDVSLTVQCYLALKLATGNAADADLRRARQALNKLSSPLTISDETGQWLYLMGQRQSYPAASTDSLFNHTALQLCKPLTMSARFGVAELGLAESSESVSQSNRGEKALPNLNQLLANDATANADSLLWQRLAIEGLQAQDAPQPAAVRQAIDSVEDRIEALIIEDSQHDSISLAARSDSLATTAMTISALRTSGASLSEVAEPVNWLMDQLQTPDRCVGVRETALCLKALESLLGDASAEGHLPPSMRLALHSKEDHASTKPVDTQEAASLATQLTSQLVNCQLPTGAWHDKAHGDVTPVVLSALACRVGTGVRPAIVDAVAYLREGQEPSGGWSSSLNDAQVIQALQAVGLDNEDPTIELAQNWLAASQPFDSNCNEETGADDLATADAYLALSQSNDDAYDEIAEEALRQLLDGRFEGQVADWNNADWSNGNDAERSDYQAEARTLVAFAQAAQKQPRTATKPVTLKLICG